MTRFDSALRSPTSTLWLTCLIAAGIALFNSPPSLADDAAQTALEAKYQEEQRAQIEAYLDSRLSASYGERRETWKRDFTSIEAYETSIAPWRQRFADYLGGWHYDRGRVDAREERIRETDTHTASRVWIKAFGGVEVYGVLLTPKKFTGKRPAVMCLHGMAGTPELVCGIVDKTDYHNRFGLSAALRGYVVFAPVMMNSAQKRNWLDRKAIMVGQRLQALEQFKMLRLADYLASRDDVDAGRIGVYGISWGGRTAMNAAALDRRIAACVISGHFMESTQKMTKPSPHYTAYIETLENYAFFSREATEFADADICSLICPRPVHIEQGRADRVAYWQMAQEEFKTVQGYYQQLGIDDRATFEVFEGGHVVAGQEAFTFLAKWLKP